MQPTFEFTPGYQIIYNWLEENDREPFTFQEKTWEKIGRGYSGMVIAPTGFGKTFSVFLGVIIDFLNHPKNYGSGLKMIWVTPLRSLAKDLARAIQDAVNDLGLDWTVETRNGDTDVKIKQRQSKSMPDILLLTPESLHLLLAQKGRTTIFKHLKFAVIDEWHELLSTKRGVMVELALSYLKYMNPKLQTWGITATIGNLEEAKAVLLPEALYNKTTTVKAKEKKLLEIAAVYPDDVETLPWAGHLGSKLVEKVVPIILESKSTLVFTNTRNQSEMWYQLLLDAYPDFAGQIALHHSSIDGAIRVWIEEALSEGKLKAVIATSSLDLGVDFKPVDTVIQVGSSKGVARFVQRAGRSGHTPHEVSRIYFLPTHSLELVEVSALKEAVMREWIEERRPLVLTFDVLVQFMVTIALGGGFDADKFYKTIHSTHAFSYMTIEEWDWCLQFITIGGKIGKNYEEFHKVVINVDGLYVVEKRRIAMLHRMNIGVIVSDAMMRVKFVTGGYIGMVEEYFITKLNIGEKFILAGRVLELVRLKDMIAYVKAAKGRGMTPSWVGGRLPLTSNLSAILRSKLSLATTTGYKDEELKFIAPLLEAQNTQSHIPKEDEFLVELIVNKEGYHLFMYPFEGRLVHEVMSSLIAYRISRLYPISFSMAMNDYGFELFSDTPIHLTDEQLKHILRKEELMEDVVASINAAEMAKRKFRDIAVIAGYVVQNVYGKQRNNKSLHSSSGIIFKTLEEHDQENLLLRQAYAEVFDQQLEEPRLRAAFTRINESKIIYTESKKFSPLSFPIKVDSLRQSLSSEDLASRVHKLIAQQQKQSKKK